MQGLVQQRTAPVEQRLFPPPPPDALNRCRFRFQRTACGYAFVRTYVCGSEGFGTKSWVWPTCAITTCLAYLGNSEQRSSDVSCKLYFSFFVVVFF